MYRKPLSAWESIIGLEIHVALNTKSKLFSTAPNSFGNEPNLNINEVCTGQPGALPVLNKEAVRKAVQFGCAINAHIAKFSTFDRKSYFYPDSPRNFQITQFYEPIIVGGEIIADVDGQSKTFYVDRAHLEDDAGTLKHFASFAGVDYNRAGIPLLEIVSTPCIHSAKEAVAYASMVKNIMEYIDASDCNMEEGNLRIDINVSTRLKGEDGLRNKIEIKNMNSFHNMEKAIDAEIHRQIREYNHHHDKEPHEVIKQSTYRWDPETKTTVLMRKKETSDDYRYFPEPDLVPIVLSSEYIDSIKESLPELPYQKEKRYINELSLSEYNAKVLIKDKKMADYFEKALETTSHAKALCTWITVEFAGKLKESGKTLWDIGIPPQEIAKLVNAIKKGIITGKIAKKVAEEMIGNPGKSCDQIIKENPDYIPISDFPQIEFFVNKVIDENQKSVEDYRSGKTKAFAFLVGQVMKLSKGTATPSIVNDLLKKRLK